MKITINQHTPVTAAAAFVAANATLAGDVELGADASVWYSAVIRADLAPIRIGARTNLQDGVVMHADPDFPATVGADVVVGHRAVLHGCTVEDGCLIGMGAIVLNGAVIGEGSLVAAGSVVGEGVVIPAGSLVAGVPATVKRPMDDAAAERHRAAAARYVEMARRHAAA